MKWVAIAGLLAGMAMSGTAFADDVLASASVSVAAPDASSEQPAEPPEITKWDTDAGGQMVLNVTDDTIDGTYELNDGKISAKKDENGDFVGIWTQSTSSTECPTEQLGSKYWGRLKFTFDEDFAHFSGAWSYCDATIDPSDAWTGDRLYEKGAPPPRHHKK